MSQDGRLARVKVCGVTRPEDARIAADLGAWAVGMILSPRGPRALDRARAERVRAAIPAGVLAVGVFVDEPSERVSDLARALGLDLVQLHGSEPPESLAALPVPALKAIAVEATSGTAPTPAEVARYAGAWGVVFDARVGRESGGTGRAFDWSLLAGEALRASVPGGRLVLAGGLDASNVGRAVRGVRPWAVDVSSGVEASPGSKDRAKLVALFLAARP